MCQSPFDSATFSSESTCFEVAFALGKIYVPKCHLLRSVPDDFSQTHRATSRGWSNAPVVFPFGLDPKGGRFKP